MLESLDLKKITAVGFTAKANADISVAGSSNAAYLSTAGNGDDEELAVGTTVDFSMSTTTSGGLGISAGLSLSTDIN